MDFELQDGEMGYYARLLADISRLRWSAFESATSTRNLKLLNKIESLKHLVIYILPYWESRSEFKWAYNEEALEEVVDKELRELRCGGLMQSAASFYEGDDVSDYNKFIFIERLALNLDNYVFTRNDLGHPIRLFLRQIGYLMPAYIGFIKLMAKWDIENLVDGWSTEELPSCYKNMEVVPRKAASMYLLCTELG